LTAHPSDEAALKREADRQHLRLTRVGTISKGRGVTATCLGKPVEIGKPGWTHD
jgi:thiamine-monophosphate kinase